MSSVRPVERLDDELPPAGGGAQDTHEPEPKRSGLFYLVGIVVFAATVIGVVGIGRHRNHEARDDAQSREADVKLGPRVRVATVKQAPAGSLYVNLVAVSAAPFGGVDASQGLRIDPSQSVLEVTRLGGA